MQRFHGENATSHDRDQLVYYNQRLKDAAGSNWLEDKREDVIET
jgi:hypothetical protein